MHDLSCRQVPNLKIAHMILKYSLNKINISITSMKMLTLPLPSTWFAQYHITLSNKIIIGTNLSIKQFIDLLNSQVPSLNGKEPDK